MQHELHDQVSWFIALTHSQQLYNVLVVKVFHCFCFTQEVQLVFGIGSYFQRLDGYRDPRVTDTCLATVHRSECSDAQLRAQLAVEEQ